MGIFIAFVIGFLIGGMGAYIYIDQVGKK